MLRKFIKRLSLAVVATVLAVSMAGGIGTAYAAKGDHGVDWSKYQGASGIWGYSGDKFAIAQIGGTTDGYNVYNQWTYPTQVSNTIAQGKRAHTYIWWQNVTTNWQADNVLNYFLPRIQTPKGSNGQPGSIVALDVEAGAQNTYAIQHACDRIRQAGYTPMVYGYKNFLQTHTDLNYLASREQLWLAEYPNYAVTPYPNYNYFPSFNNIGIFQFTSTYVAGGLDGDIDLTGITDNGYKGGNPQKPQTSTPAVNRGKQIHQDTHTYVVKSGDSWWKIAHDHSMDMNALVQLNGKTINSVIYPGEVLRVADSGRGSHVSNSVQKPIPVPNHNTGSSTYVVKSGDSWWAIANRYGMSMYALAQLNGQSINSMIYPGEVLKVNGNNSQRQSGSTYVVRYGDSWWKIANDHGMNMYSLAQMNGKSVYSMIYPGEVLRINGNGGQSQSRSYRVQYGDNLSTIAYRLGTSVSHLVSANGLSNANLIYPGQVLYY